MKRIIILFFVILSLSSKSQFLNLCNDSIYYDSDKNIVEEERYTFYYMKKYLQNTEIERISYFHHFMNKPPTIYLKYGTKDTDTIKINGYIDDFLGYLIVNDIEAKVNISFANVAESIFPGFYCSDFPKFDSLIQKSKEEISEKKYFNSQKKIVDRTYHKVYDIYENLLIPYFQNSIENRITFTEKYYKKMDLKILQLIQADLDTSLDIKTTEFVNKKHVKKIILNNIRLWRKKLEELKAEYSGK